MLILKKVIAKPVKDKSGSYHVVMCGEVLLATIRPNVFGKAFGKSDSPYIVNWKINMGFNKPDTFHYGDSIQEITELVESMVRNFLSKFLE